MIGLILGAGELTLKLADPLFQTADFFGFGFQAMGHLRCVSCLLIFQQGNLMLKLLPESPLPIQGRLVVGEFPLCFMSLIFEPCVLFL